MLCGGWNNLADAAEPNSLDLIRKLGCCHKEFIVFAAVHHVHVTGAVGSGQPIPVDFRRHTGFPDDVRQIGRKSVADINHGVREPCNGVAHVMSRLRIEMTSNCRVLLLSAAK